MATWFLLFCVLAVKHDCVFGEDLDLGEITYVSDVHLSLSHTLVLLIVLVDGAKRYEVQSCSF